MYSDSSRNLWMPWPPGGIQLLDFPQPGHRSPSAQVLHILPRHLGVNPNNDAAGQPLDPENDSSSQATRFMRLCYLVAGVYSIIAVVQMLILAQFLPLDDDLMFAGFMCIMAAMIPLLVLAILGKIRQILWVTFILSALFAELVCVGVSLVLINRTLQNVGIALVAACFLLVLCFAMTPWLPRIVLPGDQFMLVLLVFFAVASMFLITMHIFTMQMVYASAYFVVLLVMLIPVCVYHAQIVHGRRVRMPAYEYVLCGTYIYLHFMLLFCAFYHCLWVSKW